MNLPNAIARGPRGRLRTQLTLVVAAAMTVSGAAVVVGSGTSSSPLDATLGCSLGGALWLVCIASLAAWLVLGRALRPLAELAASADEINGHWERTSMDVAGDQAEVHHARSALDRALLRLRESHEALDLFVSNVAHELQDPVTTVLAEARGLTVGVQPAEALQSFVRSSRDELLRIGKIISGSVTLARLGSAEQPGALGPISIFDIALDVVKHAHGHAGQHDVRFVLTLPESEEIDVRGDSELVTSMLENVVSNAVTFSPPGEVVRIELVRVDETLQITVRDHGPGVPDLLLPYVLQPHVHGHHERHGARGRGLGLAIATKVARYHGGAIRVGNHVDGGCEVVIALPLHRPLVQQSASTPQVRRPTPLGATTRPATSSVATKPPRRAPRAAAGMERAAAS